jgi:hypothetical protein
MGIGIVGPTTAQTFSCLSTVIDPNMFVFIRAYASYSRAAAIDQNVLTTLISASNAGLSPAFYMEICRGKDPVGQVNYISEFFSAIVDKIPSLNYWGKILVKFMDNANPLCKWTGYTAQQNCEFITKAMNAFANLTQEGIVFTTPTFWATRIGSTCANFAAITNTRLLYANYLSNGTVNSSPNYNDLTPFGGWSVNKSNIFGKQIYGNQAVALDCPGSSSTARVDIYYGL